MMRHFLRRMDGRHPNPCSSSSVHTMSSSDLSFRTLSGDNPARIYPSALPFLDFVPESMSSTCCSSCILLDCCNGRYSLYRVSVACFCAPSTHQSGVHSRNTMLYPLHSSILGKSSSGDATLAVVIGGRTSKRAKKNDSPTLLTTSPIRKA